MTIALALNDLPAPAIDSHAGYLLLLARLDAETEESRLSHPLAKELLVARLDVAIEMHQASCGRPALAPVALASAASLAVTVRGVR